MKLLLDQDLSRFILPFLEADYPDSTQLASIELGGTSDSKTSRRRHHNHAWLSRGSWREEAFRTSTRREDVPLAEKMEVLNAM